MVERIKDLCAKNGMTLSSLEKSLKFANGSLAKSDGKIQSIRLKAIADYFNVSMEYLLTGDAPQATYAPHIRDFISRLISLPSDYQKAVYDALSYQEWLYEKNKAKKGTSNSSREA